MCLDEWESVSRAGTGTGVAWWKGLGEVFFPVVTEDRPPG